MLRLAGVFAPLLDAFPKDRAFAVVGGLAVSARTEPRFTRDLDLAIAVENDAEAERVVFRLQGGGFTVVATIEHAAVHRLATVRLRQHPRAPFVDLLFASCGVEPEIASAASPLELLGVTVPVATVGHLIAMKLVSRDPRRRPRDQQDLVDLARVADELEWRRADASVALIQQRGFRVGAILSPGSPRSAPSPANDAIMRTGEEDRLQVGRGLVPRTRQRAAQRHGLGLWPK